MHRVRSQYDQNHILNHQIELHNRQNDPRSASRAYEVAGRFCPGKEVREQPFWRWWWSGLEGAGRNKYCNREGVDAATQAVSSKWTTVKSSGNSGAKGLEFVAKRISADRIKAVCRLGERKIVVSARSVHSCRSIMAETEQWNNV